MPDPKEASKMSTRNPVRLSKVKNRSIALKLPVDLLDALKEMGLAPAVRDGEPGFERDLKNMIECVLAWGVWNYCRGNSPDVQMLRQPHGYMECELILRARRERREVDYLERLYRAGEGA
jgi:hypothetical protein